MCVAERGLDRQIICVLRDIAERSQRELCNISTILEIRLVKAQRVGDLDDLVWVVFCCGRCDDHNKGSEMQHIFKL